MAEKTEDSISKDKKEAENQEKPDAQMPAMSFSTFIISLNHSALFHLGVIADPSTGIKTKNIELAKQSIDIIALLGEKTKGNLTEEEDGMLKSLLYDLRMIYVKETQ